MFLPSTALFFAMAILPNGGTAKEPVAKGPYELRGQVLDVFGNNQFLLSIGTDQGARTGLKGVLVRTGSEPTSLMVEFVEVGAKHSVVRRTFFLNAAGKAYGGFYVDPLALGLKTSRFNENDAVTWYSSTQRPIPERPASPMYLQAGGAIIDLTTPAGAKMLPRMK